MPHFDYCDVLLSDLSSELSVKLQRAQNMCVRYVCNIRRYDHISPSFASLSWLRLKERRTLHSLSLLFRILHTSTPNYLSSRFSYLYSNHDVNTRSLICGTLSIPLHRTSCYSSSFTVSTSRQWNSLSQSIRGCKTINTFKNSLKDNLLSISLQSYWLKLSLTTLLLLPLDMHPDSAVFSKLSHNNLFLLSNIIWNILTFYVF